MEISYLPYDNEIEEIIEREEQRKETEVHQEETKNIHKKKKNDATNLRYAPIVTRYQYVQRTV